MLEPVLRDSNMAAMRNNADVTCSIFKAKRSTELKTGQQIYV